MGDVTKELVADRRIPYVLGIVACAVVGSVAGYRIVQGLVAGVVVCLRRCRSYLVYDVSDQPVRYWLSMVGWGLWFGLSLAFLALIASWLSADGGLFGSREERLSRRINQLRRGIDSAIFMSLIDLIPRSWRAARLDLEHVSDVGARRLSHAIVSPEGRPKVIPITGELRRATADLLNLFEQHGVSFQKVAYSVTRNENGTWRCRIDANDPDPLGHRPPGIFVVDGHQTALGTQPVPFSGPKGMNQEDV
jgi:hypothetical protein